MILKKFKGKDPHGLCDYLFGPGRSKHPGRAKVLGGTLLGCTATALAAELEAIASTRPDVRTPLLHYSISLHPNDREVAEEEAYNLGEDLAWTLDIRCWTILAHCDTQGRQHWHWVGSRVDESGVLTREHLRDYTLGMRFARRWERQLGLVEVLTPPRPDRPHGRTRNERKVGRADVEARSRGKPLGRDRLRSLLDEVESMGLRGASLRMALQAAGLDMDLRVARDRPKGITWIDQATGQRWKGSDLGNHYTVRNWLKRNALFEQEDNNGQWDIRIGLHDIHCHSALDAGRGGDHPKTCAQHAGTGGAADMDRRAGCHGGSPEPEMHRGEVPESGNAVDFTPADAGPAGSNQPIHGRTECPDRQRACSCNGEGAAINGCANGDTPRDATGWSLNAGVTLGQAGTSWLEPVPGGVGTTGSCHCPPVDLGSVEVPPASFPDGGPCCGPAGNHDSGFSGDAGGAASKTIEPIRRRGR